MNDQDDFYGLRVGDQVCVHGHGFGEIVDMHKSHWPSSDLVTVEIPREEVHKPSGQTICWTETHKTHPRHVSLNSRVAQERAAAREDKESPEIAPARRPGERIYYVEGEPT